MGKLIIKQLVVFSFLAQILCQPTIYQHRDNSKMNGNQTVSLSSIFTSDADVVEVIMSETMQTLVDLYHQKKINDSDIERLL